jgi:hypothetical protein
VFTAFGVADIRGGVVVNPGEWHHVAAAWQPGVGVTFYYDVAATEVAFTGAFLPATGSLLSVGAERMDNAFMGSLDRVRIHKAFLTAAELDSTAASSKAPLASTVAAYNFNDAGLPCQTTTSPARPASSSDEYFSNRSRPAFTSDCPSGKAGDYALSFTTATHVAVPDTAGVIALDSANPSFTAECWVKFGTLPQERSVLFGNNGPGAAFSMSVTSTRKLFVTTFGILDIPSNATIPDDGVWHHAAVVHENGKEMRFYVDGVLGDTVAYGGGVLVGVRTDTTFIIGAEPGLWNHYAGLLDRVRFTSGILTPDQLDYLAVPGVNPGAPTVDIGSMIQISWPTVPAGYKLQSTANINDSASWTFVTNAPYAGNGKFLVYLPSAGPKLFFRLVKP